MPSNGTSYCTRRHTGVLPSWMLFCSLIAGTGDSCTVDMHPMSESQPVVIPHREAVS